MNDTHLNVTAARWNADGSAEVLIGDRWALIGARTLLLTLGVSNLNDDEGPLWQASRVVLPERESIGMGELELQGFTRDAVVVVQARRAWDAEQEGRWTPGPVAVPTREEAETELDTWMTPEEFYARYSVPAA